MPARSCFGQAQMTGVEIITTEEAKGQLIRYNHHSCIKTGYIRTKLGKESVA